MDDNSYCPFIKDLCRKDCVFKINSVVTQKGVSSCLIAVKLLDINEMQHDDLAEITKAIKEIND